MKKQKPEWTPENPSDCFTTSVLPGVDDGHDGMPGQPVKAAPPSPVVRRKSLTVDDYVEGVLSGDRTILGRAITLVESNAARHVETAQKMLAALLPHTGRSMRVGITGVPGAGKSTFIEALGNLLCERGHRVAVLAVDPSSTVSRGSILGDKTRMETLCRNTRAFIRPSPSGGILGGVARKSRETMLVCEAAGFDVILVETVGVGQSETSVRSMVDFFLLVLISGAGDELQGIKRGIMEIADAVLVNKADGDNRPRALAARSELERALHYLQPPTRGWTTRALAASSRTGDGIPELWAVVDEFKNLTIASGAFSERRRTQSVEWVKAMIGEYLTQRFYAHPLVTEFLPQILGMTAEGKISPTQAVTRLVSLFEGNP